MGENEKKKKETKEKGQREVFKEVLSYAPEEPDEIPSFKKALVETPQEPKDTPPFIKKKSAKSTAKQKDERK